MIWGWGVELIALFSETDIEDIYFAYSASHGLRYPQYIWSVIVKITQTVLIFI